MRRHSTQHYYKVAHGLSLHVTSQYTTLQYSWSQIRNVQNIGILTGVILFRQSYLPFGTEFRLREEFSSAITQAFNFSACSCRNQLPSGYSYVCPRAFGAYEIVFLLWISSEKMAKMSALLITAKQYRFKWEIALSEKVSLSFRNDRIL